MKACFFLLLLILLPVARGFAVSPVEVSLSLKQSETARIAVMVFNPYETELNVYPELRPHSNWLLNKPKVVVRSKSRQLVELQLKPDMNGNFNETLFLGAVQNQLQLANSVKIEMYVQPSNRANNTIAFSIMLGFVLFGFTISFVIRKIFK